MANEKFARKDGYILILPESLMSPNLEEISQYIKQKYCFTDAGVFQERGSFHKALNHPGENIARRHSQRVTREKMVRN